jgi:hypothetical protein
LIKERKVNPNKGNILSVDHEESYEKLIPEYNVKILSRISEIHQYKLLAKMLQRKYPKDGKKIKTLKEEF